MKRTNTFNLNPTKEQESRLFKLADNCSRMYNEINYKRRQSFFGGEIDWNTAQLYKKYIRVVGSATAQQIIIKNNEAWKSFFFLFKGKKQGKLPENIKKIGVPGYWKDRKTGERDLRILIRNNCYKLRGDILKLPFKLEIKWRGRNKWYGKQGRLEIAYDRLSRKWYAFQPVLVTPAHQPTKNKKAYVDLGVKVPIMAWIPGERIFGYRANSMLADWWYLNHRIAEHQSTLKEVNNRHTSKHLSKLYRKRQRRFRSHMNRIIKDFVKVCWHKGVSYIICGDLRNIRDSAKFNKKANSMIHNFWSIGYILKRLKEKSEGYGIKVTPVDERETSSVCPRCQSKHMVKRKRLFKCLDCKLEAHRDAVGSVNIGLAQGESFTSAGVINRVVTRPSLSNVA
ncbi:putative transposase [archaeon BMS3Bbin15]|nr:putative transposase [archaeon BMS3Bbin15]